MESVGARSEKVLAEIEELEVRRDLVSKEVDELAQELEARQGKLDVARAQNAISGVHRDQVVAFEGELEELRDELSEARSTLAGLDRMLASKRQELQEAQVQDAQEALMTEKMKAALEGLEENGRALEKTRAELLGALEAGIETLLEEIQPLHRKWGELLHEREGLYTQRYHALGSRAGHGDSAYYKLQKDSLARLFEGQELPAVLNLVDMLRPLFIARAGRRGHLR
jgi:chromosome segregation ATPase